MFKNPLLHCIAKFYTWLVRWSSKLESLFLLWMRLTWGHQFFLTGMGKFAHMNQTIAYFASLNLPHPDFLAHLVATVELVGGILMMAGLATRLAAIPMIIAMFSALSLVHAPHLSEFRFITNPSSLVNQAPYPFFITSLLVLIFGPGRISVDAWLKRWAEKQPKY